MPRGESRKTELEAMIVVQQEEEARGWRPGPVLSQREQKREGCDFYSYPPDGGAPVPIEVKGWGEGFHTTSGIFRYAADINDDQLERARRDPSWRLEIVANLGAFRHGAGPVQRLSLDAQEVVARAMPWKHRVDLAGLDARVTVGSVNPR
jgi:hypothetical protein